ncbi:MAG: methyltransferase family protein [Promethearchaeota archaeon]
MKRLKKRGEKVWKESEILRTISGIFEFIIVINAILWLWFPLSFLNWRVDQNYFISFLVALIITIPCCIIMFKGIKDAGVETLKPSIETKMYGGIYKYIRHPQSLGEFPTFIALGFFVNSWFLVILFAIYIIIYIPIMIYFEEKDLIMRFGEKYKEYQNRTGAFFPKIRKLAI